MKVKYLFVIMAFLVFPGTFAFAKQLDPDKKPNFSYTVVNSSGTSIYDAPGYLFLSGKPRNGICRGLCNGWDMYLEPGEYEIVIETLHVKNIQIEEGKKLDKVIIYDRKPPPPDYNFSLFILDEDGKEATFWYLLYDARNPSKIFCFCEANTISIFKLPSGTYAMDVGFLRKLRVKNITIEEGKKLEKVVMLPPSRPSATNKKPLIPINKGSYQKAIPKILRAIERAFRNGNYFAIEAFIAPHAEVAVAQSLIMAFGNKPIRVRHKILHFKKDFSSKRITVETNVIPKGKNSGPPTYFIFEKIHGEWFITDTDLDIALPEVAVGKTRS